MITVEILERALAARDKLLADPRVLHAEITGSVRRGKTEVGDLDLLIVTRDPWSFERGELPAGTVRAGDRPRDGRVGKADIFIATPEMYGAALAFSTGPRLLNHRMRRVAFERGFLFDFWASTYDDFAAVECVHGPFVGLYRLDGRLVPTPTEEAFFKQIGVTYVPPPYRDWLAERLSC